MHLTKKAGRGGVRGEVLVIVDILDKPSNVIVQFPSCSLLSGTSSQTDIFRMAVY